MPIKDIQTLRYDPMNKVFTNNSKLFKRFVIYAFVISCVEKTNRCIVEFDDGTGILTGIIWNDTLVPAITQFKCYKFVGDLDYYSERQLIIVYAQEISLVDTFNHTVEIIEP